MFYGDHSIGSKENQQDMDVQNRDTDIIKYVCKDFGEYVV